MTKLLILAYDFPPYVSVGGLRPFSWYKYLHLFGVHPVVVTRQWSNKHGNSLDYISPGYSDSPDVLTTSKSVLIKTPFTPNLANKILLKYGEGKYRIPRKFVSLFYLFAQYFLPVGNLHELYRAADAYLKNNKADCIIATGDPFILFKYASKLSRKYSIPWIADYRDSWVQDKTFDNKLYKTWSAFFEKKFLKNAGKITTVSTFIQKQIEQNITGKDFEIVLNGFDPEILKVVKNIEQNKNTLSIALTGTIYEWHPIESFLEVCSNLLDEDSDFDLKLNFFGINKAAEVKCLIEEKFKNLLTRAEFFPRMENLKLAEKLAEQNVFLLFNDYSILGTKIFDYLAVKRKIILCYEADAEAAELKGKYFCLQETETESKRLQAEMITATNSGIVVNDSRHLKTVLLKLNAELKKNGFVKCDSVGVEKYSRIEQVERLAQIVKEVSA